MIDASVRLSVRLCPQASCGCITATRTWRGRAEAQVFLRSTCTHSHLPLVPHHPDCMRGDRRVLSRIRARLRKERDGRGDRNSNLRGKEESKLRRSEGSEERMKSTAKKTKKTHFLPFFLSGGCVATYTCNTQARNRSSMSASGTNSHADREQSIKTFLMHQSTVLPVISLIPFPMTTNSQNRLRRHQKRRCLPSTPHSNCPFFSEERYATWNPETSF
mmetsp:Transcript_55326/g.108292  ORF Transcript_55326/g.108292 Transcript_55326/m.108292 type:complete len:218 (-) Transcript_55326:376-1029(-)